MRLMDVGRGSSPPEHLQNSHSACQIASVCPLFLNRTGCGSETVSSRVLNIQIYDQDVYIYSRDVNRYDRLINVDLRSNKLRCL